MRRIRITAIAAITALTGPLLAIQVAPPTDDPAAIPAAEVRYKNIQVFRGASASEIPAVMQFIASSLGVSCGHCHSSAGFESDEKAAKRTARGMILMVRELNAAEFEGGKVITCYTCHRGSPRPRHSPPLIKNPPASETTTVPSAQQPLPNARQVIDRYIHALGGPSALQRLRTRLVTGTRVNADATQVPTEVYQTASGKALTIVTYPDITFFVGYNGREPWARDTSGGRDIDRVLDMLIMREAEFTQALSFLKSALEVRVSGRETVGGRIAYVVDATTADGATETFLFDAESGLLLVRRIEVRSLLGSYPMQIEYRDYRRIDGTLVPFAIHWSLSDFEWSRLVSSVRHNLTIPDARFESSKASN